jgi:hypothetical protein
MANLDRIINLIRKTGDKAIVLDEFGNPQYTIMSIADYEQLVLGRSEVKGLTEEELIAKINRDIAIWKDSQEGDETNVETLDFAPEVSGYGTPAAELARQVMTENPDYYLNLDINSVEEEDHYYFEPVDQL